MTEIEKPKIEITEISDDGRYGRFVCEPLERGYGITIGNSLRRMLLSSLEGAAVTSVRVDGVLHEFSTIAGVRDDVTNIILNIKRFPESGKPYLYCFHYIFSLKIRMITKYTIFFVQSNH